jgi:hypothetical protein
MHSEYATRASLAPLSASEMLCFNLSRGLHAAAQPLTILRASLGCCEIDEMSMNEFRELTAISAVEVERACALFNCLQQLVFVESSKAILSPTPIVPLLAEAALGVNSMFEKAGMLLCSLVPEDSLRALTDSARTLSALSSVLLAAYALSHAQDTIEMIATSSSRMVRIVVLNVKSNVVEMDAETSMNMALAEANIRSQRGDFSWTLKPFSVQIELQQEPRQ